MKKVQDYRELKNWKDWVVSWVRCNILGEHQYHDATVRGPYCRFCGRYYWRFK